MGSEPRRAIGIDPGTARLGYAVVESRSGALTLIACGCVTTPPSMSMPDRLKRIYDETQAIIAAHSPREMAVEELFFAKNVTTAVAVGQARGVARLRCRCCIARATHRDTWCSTCRPGNWPCAGM